MMRPAAVTVCLAASFAASLFFTGHRNIIYAPAAFLLLAGACVAVIPAFRRRCSAPVSAAAFLLFVLALYVTVSLVWSTVPFVSMVTWIVFIALPVTFFSLSVPEDRRALIVSCTCALLAILSVLGGWAIAQAVFFADIYDRRAHHPLLNANDLAALLNLGLFPVLSFLLWRRQRDKYFYAAIAAAFVIFGGLLATQSRSGFLFMLIAAGLLFAIHRPPLKVAAAGLCAGAAAFIVMLFASGGGFAGRLMEILQPAQDPNIISRLSLWKSTIAMLGDHLWTGTGLGTFYLYYPPYRPPMVENSAGFFAHMDPLQFGAETGIVAVLLIYCLFAAVAWRSFVALRQAERGSAAYAAVAGFSCALLTLALHAHAGFPLYVMPVLIVAGVWLAAWQMFTAEALTERKNYAVLDAASWERVILAVSVAGTAAMIMLLAASSAAGQYYAARATAAVRDGSVAKFLENIEAAERYAPASFIEPEVQLAGFYVDAIGGAGILFSKEDGAKMSTDALALLAQAENMNPAWAEIDFKRGRLHAVRGEPELAVAAYGRALGKDPLHFRARLELAKAAFAAGRPADAYDLLSAGLKYPQPRQVRQEYEALLAQIADVAQRQKEFIGRSEKR